MSTVTLKSAREHRVTVPSLQKRKSRGEPFAMLTAFLVLAMERRSVTVAIAIGVGTALGFYLILSLALGVPLPSGPWGL